MTTESSADQLPDGLLEDEGRGATSPRLVLEARPRVVFAALYDKLPFPHLEPKQEFAFDLGVTAIDGSFGLLGVVIRGFSGHQLLFEQRWPERIIRQKTKLEDLDIPAGTGIALRAMHFQLHGYERLTLLELTVVARREDTKESVEAVLHVPVEYPLQKIDLHFPLSGTWWAIQGADWTGVHKAEVISQPYAIDFVRLGAGHEFFRNGGTRLEDHESWNQPVYAAAGGKIAYAEHDMPDMPPGAVPDPAIFRGDPRRLLGNAVAISHGNGEFSYYAHLRQGSLQVRYGEMVRRGALIGSVGSSGQSPGPHLHFHVMNGPNLQLDQGLPLRLSHFSVGGQFYDEPIAVPARMLISGPSRPASDDEEREL